MCFFAGATVILIRDTLVSIDTVNGISMSPTLSPGVHERAEVEYVLLVPGSKVLRELQRGDIVTFWKPHQPEEISIKRIIALAGDTVYPRRGYATKLSSYTERHTRMNDGLPTDEDLAVLADKGEEVEVGKVVVPHGHVWVEGDNWRKTYDSNDFGPISVALINGRAERVFRNWWFRPIEDKREKKHRTRVIEGRSVVPEVYLE
jgi:inner membrane protease subunit 2